MKITAYRKNGIEYVPICLYKGCTIMFFRGDLMNNYSYFEYDISQTAIEKIETDMPNVFIYEAIQFILDNEAGGIKSVMYDIDRSVK